MVILFGLQFAASLVLSARMTNKTDRAAKKMEGVSIIIPFHNEFSRIMPLLESLNRQQPGGKPVELIFADDCSTDATAERIRSTLKIPFSIIQLDHKSGKKQALHQAILKARHDFILTLDADVELPDNYIHSLFQLPESDMTILPVKMGGKKLHQHLAAVEFDWLQILTFGAAKPGLCNGANLLFRKSAYLNVFASRSDFDLASGDDVFLLSAFLKLNRKINRIHDDELTVKTPAPQNAKELFQQRRRWIGKLSRMGDAGSYVMLLFLVALQAGFIFSVCAVFFNPLYLFIIALKLITEFMLAANAAHADIRTAFATTLVHQFWYPLYLILLLLPAGKEERWVAPQSR